MDELELKALVGGHIGSAVGFLDSEIVAEREAALAYYRGDPYGDEKPGHSQVVSRDVMDTVEWILPNLMRIFHGNDRIVAFAPTGPEDEAVAEQATDYVNFVYNHDNEGFLVTYTWLKDGLIQKVGIVKHWWLAETRTSEQRYHGLTEDELAAIAGAEGVEVVEAEVRSQKSEVSKPNGVAEEGGTPVGVVLYDVRIRRTWEHARVRVEPVPPEEFLISRRAKSLEDADFVAHRTSRTRSELIAQGYERALVERLPAGDGELDGSGERETRFDDEAEIGDAQSDESRRRVALCECYLRVDFDGDGIAELRQVVLAGDGAGAVLLGNEEIDEIPFTTWCPVPMPHRFWGMSVAEAVMDLQLIKSTLLRQMLDNLYLTNNPEMEVVWDEVVQDDALTRRPGGIKRVKQPGMYRPLDVPFVAGASFPMLEYLDRKQEGRTGVSAASTGMSPDLLQNQTATGVNQVMTAAQQRIDLIARIFAETGLKRLMRQVLKLVVKHQDKARTVRLRGEWVPMDPRAWNAGMDVSVDVGLGTGSRDRQLAHLATVLQYQKEALALPQLGLVKPKSLYNTLEKLTKLVGLPSVEPFFVDPESAEGEAVAKAATLLAQGKGGGGSGHGGPGDGGKAEAGAYLAAEQLKARQRAEEAAAKREIEVLKLTLEDRRERDRMEAEVMLKAAALEIQGAKVSLEALKAAVQRPGDAIVGSD